ncbi:MAG: hypothetical protein HY901_11520 [Deltaproteobacteria bacterium]|nr:hypothetical protein [Deltaproteobacteria bacterium]
MRQALFAAAVLIVGTSGCLEASSDHVRSEGADAQLAAPAPDGGASQGCVADSDCPTPASPDPVCAPWAAICESGTCVVSSVPRPWEADPGSCAGAADCACQPLNPPPCIGAFECLAGRCSYRCGACQIDADCVEGSVCDVDSDGARSCFPGCRDSSQCSSSEECVLDTCLGCMSCACYGHCRPSTPCESDAQCPAGTVCGTEPLPGCQQRCVPGCRTDSECAADERCAPPPGCPYLCGCDYGTCVPRPLECAAATDCPTGQVCAFDDALQCSGSRHCVTGCFAQEDCQAGESCLSAHCGPCCAGTCIASGSSGDCTADAQCASGEVCLECPDVPAQCVPGCRGPGDCSPGELCVAASDCEGCPCPGSCVAAPSVCSADSDCGLGAVCEPGLGCSSEASSCVPGCHDSSQCAAGEECSLRPCATCPCPGICQSPGCGQGSSACSTGFGCAWSASFCEDGCCAACPAYPPATCAPGLCRHEGGMDVHGCALPSFCGACCECPALESPVCAVSYQTYPSDCEASCAGIGVLHRGACDPYEGMECSPDSGCAASQYCRDTCPLCDRDLPMRCTRIGTCAVERDCPGGLGAPSCSDGATQWRCVDHACVATCP